MNHVVVKCCFHVVQSPQCYEPFLLSQSSGPLPSGGVSVLFCREQELLFLPSIHGGWSNSSILMRPMGGVVQDHGNTVPSLGRGCPLDREITDMTLTPRGLCRPTYQGMFSALEAKWIDGSIFTRSRPCMFIVYLLPLGKFSHFPGINSNANVSTAVHYFSWVSPPSPPVSREYPLEFGQVFGKMCILATISMCVNGGWVFPSPAPESELSFLPSSAHPVSRLSFCLMLMLLSFSCPGVLLLFCPYRTSWS